MPIESLILPLIITLSLFSLLIYFGYKEDFKRDKQESTYLVLSVLVMFLAFILLIKVDDYLAYASVLTIWSLLKFYKSQIIRAMFGSKK